jgi:hypothetical protein
MTPADVMPAGAARNRAYPPRGQPFLTIADSMVCTWLRV